MAGFGKVDPRFMREVVMRSLGKASSKVVLGPRTGLDNAIVSLGGGRVLIATSDPVSVIPALGMEASAWLSVHLIASDFTSSGVNPEFATFTFNFPHSMGAHDRKRYLSAVGKECGVLGISIIGGHTGSYPGADYSVVGSGTMLGVSGEGEYVSPAMSLPGDILCMTKHAGIEAAAVLAGSYPGFLAKRIGRKRTRQASSMVKLCSTVGEARAGARSGIGPSGVTSMHDATEGGIIGAVHEMAVASGLAFHVDEGKIPVKPWTSAVCRAFGIDPLTSLSEGALLLTCRPGRVASLEREMKTAGVDFTEIGLVKRGKGVWSGSVRLPTPTKDGYWEAYSRAKSKRLR